MHDTGYEHGRLFFELYGSNTFRTIVELGSQDVNGTLRDHCPPTACYIGLDMMPAKGVDVVINPTCALPIASDQHRRRPLPARHSSTTPASGTRSSNCCASCGPAACCTSTSPATVTSTAIRVDCWRFFPDAGMALVQWGQRRRGIQVGSLWKSFIGLPKAERWSDFVAVFRKQGGPSLISAGRIADHAEAITSMAPTPIRRRAGSRS